MPTRKPARENGAATAFNYLLPSAPIPLPFEGHYAQVRVIYNAQKALKINQTRPLILEKILAEERVLRKRSQAAIQENSDAWEAFNARLQSGRPAQEYLDDVTMLALNDDLAPEEALASIRRAVAPSDDPDRPDMAEQEAFLEAYEERTRAVARLNQELDALQRRKDLRLIAEVVDHLEWPDGSAPPDPQDPRTWDPIPDLIISWIVSAEGGLQLVREGLKSPLASPRSSISS